MHQPKLRTPLGVLVLGFVIAISVFFRNELPIARSQDYPAPVTTTAITPATATAFATATVTLATPTNRSVPTSSVPTVAPTNVAPNSAPTPFGATPTRALTPTVITSSNATPTPIQPSAAPAIPECRPGSTLLVRGTAPAKAALLLFFDERAVGGGTAKVDGSFVLPLKVGHEKPGIHTITVRVRGPMTAVLQSQCVVPNQ